MKLNRYHILEWRELDPLPDRIGLAGMFGGVTFDKLLVAGGTNFPHKIPPSPLAKKVWYDSVYLLESLSGKWKQVGHLPRACAYGVSVTWKNQVICIGGCDSEEHLTDVFALSYREHGLVTEWLPSLPIPLAYSCGAITSHDLVYVAGGRKHPHSSSTENLLLRLDLSQRDTKRSWQILESWPGPSRMLSVAGALGKTFYLFSGVHLSGTSKSRQYLIDSYRFNDGKTWSRLSDLPMSFAAAPSPALPLNSSNLLLVGGDEGNIVGTSTADGCIFSNDVWCMDVDQSKIRKVGTVGYSTDSRCESPSRVSVPVTTPAIDWNGNLVIPGGEISPGRRSNRILIGMMRLHQNSNQLKRPNHPIQNDPH